MPQARAKGPKAACDRLYSLIVREKGQCERCGKYDERPALQCAHIIRRTYSATRCMIGNAWCLCPACHWETEKDGVEFTRLVESTIGLDRYEELRQIARDGVGAKTDWSEERKRLKRIADGMGVRP